MGHPPLGLALPSEHGWAGALPALFPCIGSEADLVPVGMDLGGVWPSSGSANHEANSRWATFLMRAVPLLLSAQSLQVGDLPLPGISRAPGFP